MATLEDVYPIVSDLTAKLRMPQPQITIGAPKVAFYSAPAFLGKDGLRISPETLESLSLGQLKICLAYALVNSKNAKKTSNIVVALCLAVILPLGTACTLTKDTPAGIPSWFRPAAFMGLGLYFYATILISLWSARQTDAEVLRITNDLSGIREYLMAGAYFKKNGSPVVAKPSVVEKRMAHLQSK